MNNITKIEDFLEELAEELEPFEELIPNIMEGIKKTKQPLSIFSATSFVPKIESIRYGMFQVAKKQEYYSLNILYRSLIEHYVKAQYISMKTFDLKDDSIGIEYWVFGQDKELIDFAKNIESSYALLGIVPDKSTDTILREVGIINENKSKNLIRKKTEQFRYKNMVYYISNSLKPHGKSSSFVLASIFPLYTELSSFVHGGPESIYAYISDEDIINSIVEKATFISLFTRWNSYIHFYQFDKRAEPLCKIVKKYLDSFMEVAQ